MIADFVATFLLGIVLIALGWNLIAGKERQNDEQRD